MKNGIDSLDGSMEFSLKWSPASFFEPPTGSGGYYIAVSVSGAGSITVSNANGTSMKFGGGATPLITADVGKGQGMWLTTFQPKLNIITPTQQLKRPTTQTQHHMEPSRRTIYTSAYARPSSLAHSFLRR